MLMMLMMTAVERRVMAMVMVGNDDRRGHRGHHSVTAILTLTDTDMDTRTHGHRTRTHAHTHTRTHAHTPTDIDTDIDTEGWH
eukprot:293556-Rhodomonas_salina.1